MQTLLVKKSNMLSINDSYILVHRILRSGSKRFKSTFFLHKTKILVLLIFFRNNYKVNYYKIVSI